MSRGRRMWLSAIASAAVLLGALGFVTAGGWAQATPRCPTSNLRLDFVDGQGATSHRYWDLALRNVGSRNCYLKGFPRVALLNSRAAAIKDRVLREQGFTERIVVLAPWQSAYFSFGYAVSGPCLPNFFYAYGIEVFPPGSRQRLVYYRGRFDVCGASITSPRVYPVRPKLSPV